MARITGYVVAGLAVFSASAWGYSSGRFTSSETGGPFPGERDCTRCHQGSEANSGGGTVGLTIGGVAPSEFSYTPGEAVALLISFTDANAALAGFQLTLRSGEGCDQPGSLAMAESDAGARVKVVEGTCGDSTIQWATHTQPAIGSPANWEVAWTPPAEDAGPVTIAFAVNGANGDRNRTGDSIYTYSARIEAAAQVAPPVISDGGILLADIVSGTTTGAPNAVAVAQGSGFTQATASIPGQIDESGKVSAILDGTCLEVNLIRSPIIQLDASEVTFQIPTDAGLGAASAKVIRGCDTPEAMSSNSAMFQIEAVKPVFFQFSDDPAGISALHADLTLVGESGALEGRTTRPASPGKDFVTLFGTGFGPTVPESQTGEIITEPRRLAATAMLRPMLGELEVPSENIAYAGAAPNFAGVYQLTFLVPENVPAGEHAMSVLLDGVASAAGPRLWVAEPQEAASGACSVGLKVPAGGSCEVESGGTSATFEVNEQGQGCVVAGMESTCGDTTVSAHEIEAAQDMDGSWTISRLPAEPEMGGDEDEIQACAVDLVIKPGEQCETVIFGGTVAFFRVDKESGEACAGAPSLGVTLCEMDGELNLSIVGAEVARNDDGSWTIKKLPPPPEDP